MFFLSTTDARDIDGYVKQLRMWSRHAIVLYPRRATEAELDKYIQERYGTNLVLMCLRIWRNAKFSVTQDKDVIVTIPDRKLDEAAAIITYGTGRICGSRILRSAFSHDERRK